MTRRGTQFTPPPAAQPRPANRWSSPVPAPASVYLTWAPVSGAQSYSVQEWVNTAPDIVSISPLIPAAGPTSFMVTGLTKGTAYQFRVVANNRFGQYAFRSGKRDNDELRCISPAHGPLNGVSGRLSPLKTGGFLVCRKTTCLRKFGSHFSLPLYRIFGNINNYIGIYWLLN